MLIEPNNTDISIARQCELLGLHRSVYYYRYKGLNEYTEILMCLIDERYTKRPHEGSRKIMRNLNKQGYDVTRNQVRYLMDKMGLQTIHPKPNTSAKSREEHQVYPYHALTMIFLSAILLDNQMQTIHDTQIIFENKSACNYDY